MSKGSSSETENEDARRALPSVGALLEMPAVQALLKRAPRTVVVAAARAAVQGARTTSAALPRDEGHWADAIGAEVARLERPSLRPVLNATGVVLHTNLGRAPLPPSAIAAIERVARGFSNLEYDMDTGRRGSRYAHCTGLLRELTGAEDAIVVNNGAAALVLALNTLAEGRDAIISRGELVEIGGSFRVPEIMRKSGARLVEIGTTNRTHLDDYRRALAQSAAVGAIVKVHRSNFAIEGFVAEAGVVELAGLVGGHVPIIHDLGSGLLLPLDSFGLRGEPTAHEALRDGATIVTMSGDKLLGGPQAGIIVGRQNAIDALRRNPLTRSFRVDKLTLAALEATLALYRDPTLALREIPALAMLTADVATLRARASRLLEHLAASGGARDARIEETDANVGGGAFPTARIPSIAVSFGGDASALEEVLRRGNPPVIARLSGERLFIDLRSILPNEDEELARAIRAALDGTPMRGA